MSNTLVLIACSKSKAKTSTAIPASELYTGQAFQKCQKLTGLWGHSYAILSAQYGLIQPDAPLENYELHISKLKKAERDDWSTKVIAQLQDFFVSSQELPQKIIFLAPAPYRHKLLLSFLQEQNIEFEAPMEGLGIGNQLGWLKRHITELS